MLVTVDYRRALCRALLFPALASLGVVAGAALIVLVGMLVALN